MVLNKADLLNPKVSDALDYFYYEANCLIAAGPALRSIQLGCAC